MNEKDEILQRLKEHIPKALDKLENGDDLTESECYKIIEDLADVVKQPKAPDFRKPDAKAPAKSTNQDLESTEKIENPAEGIQMNTNINDLITDFNTYASSSKGLLKEILSTISEGKVPHRQNMEELNLSIDNLREKYDSICFAVSNQLPSEELPEKGSSAYDYVKAFENSETLKYQKAIAKAKDILQSFIAVKAETETFTEALKSYQEEAISLLGKIDSTSDEDLNVINNGVASPSLFLDAIECDNLADNIDIYGKAMNTFNPMVVLGISNKKYYIDLKEKKELQDHSFSSTKTDESNAEEAIEVSEEASDLNREKVKSDEIDEPKKNYKESIDSSDNNKEIATGAPAESKDFAEEAAWMPLESEDDVEDATWESIGIENPDDVCIDLNQFDMEVQVAPRQKKFNVSAFKNEMRTSYLGAEKLIIMKAIYDMHGIIDSFAAFLADIEEDDFNAAAEKLIKAGYIKKHTVTRNHFEKYDSLYDLTPNGIKAFNTKGSADVLKHKIIKDDNYAVFVPNNITATLSRVVFYRAIGLNYKVSHTRNLTAVANILSEESFLTENVDNATGKNYLLSGIVSNDPDAYQNFISNIIKNFDHPEKFVIAGLDRETSKNIALWTATKLPREYDKGHIYYFAADSFILYSLLDDSEVELPLFSDLEELDGNPNNISTPDGTTIVKEDTEQTILESDLKELHSMDNESGNVKNNDSTETVRPIEPVISTEKQGATFVLPQDNKDLELNDENAEQRIEEVKETEAPATIGDQRTYYIGPTSDLMNDYRKKYQQMLITGEYYCATAYLHALSDRYEEFKPEYEQIAYALNDPLAMCYYSSDKIFEVFFSSQLAISEYYTICAVIRNYFLDQCRYDYSLQSLQDSISGYGLIQKNHALSQVIYLIQKFKSSNNRGMDFYADYRQMDEQRLEKEIYSIRAEAKEFYEQYCIGYVKEPVMPILKKTKELILSVGTDMAYCVEVVKDDKREELELLKDYLVFFIKEGEDIHEDNIDPLRIDAIIDEKWQEAAKLVPNRMKKTSTMIGNYRSSTVSQMLKLLSLLCRYYKAASAGAFDADDSGMIEYKRIKKDLVQNIHRACDLLHADKTSIIEENAGISVLEHTLNEILSRIEGSYVEHSKRYYYIDFLKSDKVTLDDNYFPMLDDVSEVDELSALARIEEHFSEEHGSLEDNFKRILEGEDDYGTAKQILSYLESNPNLVKDKDLFGVDISKAEYYPRKDMEIKRKAFIEDLELAQSYGQIDNTVEDRKESFIQIMDSWYTWAMDTSNYGFYYKILEAIRKKIRDDAQVRAHELENNLRVYMDDHKNWEEDAEIETTVRQINNRISNQNYAAAEDLLNRLISGDLSTETIYDLNQDLEEFINEYTLNANKVSKAGSTVQALHTRIYNKDSKGANRLIEYWPNHKGTSASRIASFLSVLGFSIENVVQQPDIQGKDHYLVTLKKPINGRKSNYKHPIAVFGSEAEEKGFRVVNIYGKMDASRLIDTFKEIGTARTTMILLDYSLNLPDRRELARRTKTEYNGKTFIVIDRVVLAYLANHYSETAINRKLMAVTMPYASYQPYVAESSMIMPQEIFMGRRKELDRIESATGVNIVYGGRQLGKSALLRMAKKDIDKDENGDRAVLVDIKGLDYKAAAKKISGALYDEGVLLTEHITEDWDELSRDIRNRLRDETKGRKIPYFLLLLDEADVFIESCESVGYRPFDALKDIQGVGSGRFKFVVAGLRNIVRFKKNAALSNNSVITHLGSLTVTPFKSVEARELLEVPLSYLGFRFPNDNKTEMLISTIFGTTNYFPGLIQLYCSKLIEAMQRDYAGYDENETPPYYVREEHIKKALADKTLEQQIREKFIITLKVDEDDYYYLIALLAAYNYHNNKGQNGCGAEDIINIANDFGIEKISTLSIDKVLALMEEMRELNILQQVRDGRYRFARHSFCQMMGSITQIDDEIMKYAVDEEM